MVDDCIKEVVDTRRQARPPYSRTEPPAACRCLCQEAEMEAAEYAGLLRLCSHGHICARQLTNRVPPPGRHLHCSPGAPGAWDEGHNCGMVWLLSQESAAPATSPVVRVPVPEAMIVGFSVWGFGFRTSMDMLHPLKMPLRQGHLALSNRVSSAYSRRAA